MAVRSSVSPSFIAVSSDGFASGSVLGSTPAPGRKGVTGGTSPRSPGIMIIPLGIGMGMAISIVSPDMPAIPAIPVSAPIFMPAMPVSAPILIPAIPVSAGIFFIVAGGLTGGFCCAAAGATANASANPTNQRVFFN